MAAPCGKDAKVYFRGSEGIWRTSGVTPPYAPDATFCKDTSRDCRSMVFSPTANYSAWHNGSCIQIHSVKENNLLHTIEAPAVSHLHFSPKGTVLAAWHSLTVKDKQPIPNLHLYETSSGQKLASFVQKRAFQWEPQWSYDEKICSRLVNNELQFYEDNDYTTIKNKLHLQKVNVYSVAQNTAPYSIAAYIPGTKGLPGNVRAYHYPNFSGLSAAIASKSFFKADRVNIEWNSKGTALLILTSTETSESSYYGEQGLHFLALNGDSCVVPLSKNGPVYTCTWHPAGHQFTVLYGYMPAKATIFNMKNEPVFDFGTGSRNQAYYNPFGNIMCLAGFGNLQGRLEFWDLEKNKLISELMAADTTFFQWAPDGKHAITATLAPRMRVGNGYRIWHYTGSLMKQVKLEAASELWQVCWAPVLPGTFSTPTVSYTAVQSDEKPPPPVNAPAYRPPGARGKPAPAPLHVLEPPSNPKLKPGMAPPDDTPQTLSKNQKRKRAKAAAQAAAASKTAGEDPSQDAVKPPPVDAFNSKTRAIAPSGRTTGEYVPLTGDPEKDKKIRNLSKKLQQIEKLKSDVAAGVKLQNNQMEKLSKEGDILDELESLAL